MVSTARAKRFSVWWISTIAAGPDLAGVEGGLLGAKFGGFDVRVVRESVRKVQREIEMKMVRCILGFVAML